MLQKHSVLTREEFLAALKISESTLSTWKRDPWFREHVWLILTEKNQFADVDQFMEWVKRQSAERAHGPKRTKNPRLRGGSRQAEPAQKVLPSALDLPENGPSS